VQRNDARTRISPSHQITIPSAPFRAAGFDAGDRLIVEATGPGQATIKRIEPIAQLALD
jgi:bifunctional DNA-binding transcriptional regulator/antitoxin component of YhaV-PrlF toxin-antitoxin module